MNTIDFIAVKHIILEGKNTVARFQRRNSDHTYTINTLRRVIRLESALESRAEMSWFIISTFGVTIGFRRLEN